MSKCSACEKRVRVDDMEDDGHWIYDGGKMFCPGPIIK